MTRLQPSNLLLACLALAVTLAPAPTASAQNFAPPTLAFTTPASDDFSKGTLALDQQHWQDAITSFDRIISSHGQRAAEALYWKSYALNKLGRSNLVSATCGQLHTTYPHSTWNRDCSTLSANQLDPGIYAGGQHPLPDGSTYFVPQPNDNGIYRRFPPNVSLNTDQLRDLQKELQNIHVETGPNADQLRDLQRQFQNMHIDAGLNGAQLRELQKLQTMHIDAGPNADQLRDLQRQLQSMHVETGLATGSDADLKMLALNSLLQRNPAQALPAIRNILTGANSSPQLKQRAITALAMNQSPESQTLLRDVATGKIAPEEQRQAIQMLGVFQGKRADDTLAEIYRDSPNHDTKEAAITSLFIAGDATRLVDLARNEKDLTLKHDIVTKLALMHDKAATDYMLELLK